MATTVQKLLDSTTQQLQSVQVACLCVRDAVFVWLDTAVLYAVLSQLKTTVDRRHCGTSCITPRFKLTVMTIGIGEK